MIDSPPPEDYAERSPSVLFSYFRGLGGWTLAEMADDVGRHIKNETLGEGTIDGWSSKDRRPEGIFRMAFLNFVRSNVTSRNTKYWIEAFSECWAENLAQETARRLQAKSEKRRNSAISRNIFERHRNWIGEQNLRTLRDENFTLRDIYVPIMIIAYGVETGLEKSDQVFTPDYLYEYAISGIAGQKDTNWLFIKGGPGSGKSALANMLASDLTKQDEVEIAFFNMSRASAENTFDFSSPPLLVSDSCGPKSLLEAFENHSKKELFLILDGLDEIGGDNTSTQSLVSSTLKKIDEYIQMLKTVHKKTVRVLALGRETITEVAAKNFNRNRKTKLFSMGNLSGMFSSHPQSQNYGVDLRGQWWAKFLEARGYEPRNPLPRFLCHSVHPLYELGKEPLLAYLITRSALSPETVCGTGECDVTNFLNEQVNSKNRNSIYDKIIHEIRLPKEWSTDRSDTRIPQTEFSAILKYMALATWQEGSSVRATVKRIEGVIADESVLAAFRLLTTRIDETGSLNLLTAFYYRISEAAEDRLEYEFEFTHKTFSEYLLATLLFDAFEGLIRDQTIRTSEAQKIAHMREWIELVMAGPDTEDIARFILDEAVLRFDRFTFEEWTKSFDAFGEISALKKLADDDTGPWLIGQSSPMRLRRATTMIFLMWGALNRVRYQRTKKHYSFGEGNSIEGYELQLMRPQFEAEQYIDGVEMNEIQVQTFLASALSGLHIQEDDLTGSFLANGSITGLKLEDLNASQSLWNEIRLSEFAATSVNLRNSRLKGTSISGGMLEQVCLRQCRFERFTATSTKFINCQFEQGEFHTTTFHGCQFTDAYFCRADMTGVQFISCSFEGCDFEACLQTDTAFAECTFEKTSFDRTVFPEDNFESCKGHTWNS